MAKTFGWGFAEPERESGVSNWTWRRLADRGIIRTIYIGARRLVPNDEVERIQREGVPRKRGAK
jgi:hypothetical protein